MNFIDLFVWPATGCENRCSLASWAHLGDPNRPNLASFDARRHDFSIFSQKSGFYFLLYWYRGSFMKRKKRFALSASSEWPLKFSSFLFIFIISERSLLLLLSISPPGRSLLSLRAYQRCQRAAPLRVYLLIFCSTSASTLRLFIAVPRPTDRSICLLLRARIFLAGHNLLKQKLTSSNQQVPSQSPNKHTAARVLSLPPVVSFRLD